MAGTMSLAALLNPTSVPPRLNPTPIPIATSPEGPCYFSESRPSSIGYNIYVSRQTTLIRLYTFDNVNAYIEYPETDETGIIGYLFRCDPTKWQLPEKSFAYGLGAPSGHSKRGKSVKVSPLINSAGEQVECQENHYTCQGVKVCPQMDLNDVRAPHTSASRQDIMERLSSDRENRLLYASPLADVFKKTQALITGLRRTSCRTTRQEETHRSHHEQACFEELQQSLSQFRRGYHDPVVRCEGDLYLDFDADEKPFIACQHYNPDFSRNHMIYYLDESYDIDYIEAVFHEDEDEINRIESSAQALGYGPRVECTTITNSSSQRTFCPHDHRDEATGVLQQLPMIQLECGVKFRIFQPLEDYRAQCPYILVTIKGAHFHPVPLPLKTPPKFRDIVLDLIDQTGTDLPDLTARRFLRHPLVRGYLQKNLPITVNSRAPVLHDLHPSLANRAHLFSYIKAASRRKFPYGTEWEGAKYLQAEHAKLLPPSAQYIRRFIEVKAAAVRSHPDDQEKQKDRQRDLRILVCMFPEASHRLLKAQYFQGDVSFKRVDGYNEFELASLDRDANTGLVFSRVFITRETAYSHQLVFKAIHEIVREDTGRELRWRHLHATSLDDFDRYILQFTADQHGGQAKAWNETLKEIAVDGKVGHDWINNKINSKFALQGMCWEKGYIPLSVWKAGDSMSNLIESVHFDANTEGKGCSLIGGIEKGHVLDSLKLSTLKTFESHRVRPSYKSSHISENAERGIKRRYLDRHRYLESQDRALENHQAKVESAAKVLAAAEQLLLSILQ
ncbi:hypothetical protein C8J56DRAFT_1065197 [Mycena floridula]|nr:hypothetical protein C8J56DRAFT_1065197 [Mycena floridula]